HLVAERGVVLLIVERGDGTHSVRETGLRGDVLDALAAQPALAPLRLPALDLLGALPCFHRRDSLIHRRASAGGAPAPRRPAARTILETLPELQILAGRGVRVSLDQSRARGLDARAHAPDEPLLEDRGHQHLVGNDLLDLMELRLALLAIELLRLALEQVIDLRQRPVRVEAALGEKRLEPRRRVAGRAGRTDEEPLQLFLLPCGI